MRRSFDSGILDLLTGDASTEVITPLGGAHKSAEWQLFTVETWLRALVAAKLRIGVQFSNYANHFTDAPKEIETAYLTANGWDRDGTVHDLFAITGVTRRPYFRFVALGLNTTGALAGSGQIRIIATPTPLAVVHQLASKYLKVNTKGSDATAAKHPAIGPVPAAGITEHRVTLDVVGISGGIKIQVAAQETDTPDDVTTWVAVATVGSEVSATGVTFPTDFTAIAFTKRYVRWVINAKNETLGTDIEAAIVRILIDARG